MTKTANSVTFRFAKVEVEITAAMVTAIAGFTTAERIDLSSVFSGPLEQVQAKTKDVTETPVSGDADPIVGVGPGSARRYRATLLYTEGETLGTDNLDPYADIFKPLIDHDDGELVVPFHWSPKGGASGDQEFSTSSTGCYITSVTDPVGGVDSNKIMFSVEFVTEDLAVATVA